MRPTTQSREQPTPNEFSVAVLPFLKTSGPLQIGGFIFRSTDDVSDISEQQAAAVREIADMLFLQDDLRVRSASYAIAPKLDFGRPNAGLFQLQRIHTVLSYLYSVPHEMFDRVFLGPSETSLALFTPARVSAYLIRPVHNTLSVATTPEIPADDRHELQGYYGLYNFRDHFWVVNGSRVYGSKRHITLNNYQDLAQDLAEPRGGRSARSLLFDLLCRFEPTEGDRILIALDWYNAAHPDVASRDQALLNLAVAFESLLCLPRDAKSARFVEAVSLLLGRTERLDQWARQFYDARSHVAHEGHAREHFYMVPPAGGRQEAKLFGSLMLHGRQVFRLCLTAILFGMDLAQGHRLAQRLVNNSERYDAICEALKPEAGEASERLAAIESLVREIGDFRFVAAGGSPQGPMLAAVRAAANALSECDGLIRS